MNNLSSNLKNKIQLFYKEDKPLFIYGEEKINKTELGKEILKDYQYNIINSYDIKRYKNIKDVIMNTISKRNITLMFDKKKERGFIFDDLDIFQKMDKKNYKEIINFLKIKKYYGCKIVVIFNESLYTKKEVSNVDSINLYLGKDNCNQLTLKKCIENLSIVKELLENSRDIKDIINYNLGDENVFLLNILENIFQMIKTDNFSKIYQLYIYYDYFELFTTQYHIWEFKEYSKNIIMRYIYIHSIYKDKKVPIERLNSLKYNSYISKSILSVSLSGRIEMNSYISIYLCLYMINKKRKKKYEKYLENISDKKMIKLKKIYFENY